MLAGRDLPSWCSLGLLLVGLAWLVACARPPLTSTPSAAPTELSGASIALQSRPVVDSPPTLPSSTTVPLRSIPTPSPYPVSEPCGVLLPVTGDDPQQATSVPAEGALPSEVPEAARPALDRLLQAPDTVGLAAFQPGREAAGVYLNADTRMPLASVVKIVNLAAYAQAVDAGLLDPAEWVALDDIDRYYLPGSNLGAHNRALTDLRERNLVAYEPPATPMEELPGMMIRYSSNAASDYLHLRLGQRTIEQTALDIGLSRQTAPCPWLGQFLVMSNHTRVASDGPAVRQLVNDPARYGFEVMSLTLAYAADPDFRAAEQRPRWRAPLASQRLLAAELNARGTAREYANLMARIQRNNLATDYQNIIVRRALEWPTPFPDNQALFSTVGYKDGSLPGILTTVYYARRLVDQAPVVVALFYRDLPQTTYRRWRQTLSHDELARWLLADPAAIPTLRQLLSQSE